MEPSNTARAIAPTQVQTDARTHDHLGNTSATKTHAKKAAEGNGITPPETKYRQKMGQSSPG